MKRDGIVELRSVSVLCLIVGLSGAGCAQGPGPRGGPPPEAIDACASRMTSDACEFVDGQQSIPGTCQEKGGDLVCVPDREPPPDQRGTPDSRDRGSDAYVAAGAGTAAGTGLRGRDGQAESRESAGQTPPPEALDACEGFRPGSECYVQTPHGEERGACSYAEGQLACIPDRPPRRPD